jgi:UPF0716 protein FxsA
VFLYLVFFFTVMPLVELFFLIRAGQVIGLWNTVAVVLVTGILGAAFARSQGQAIWREVNQKLQKGEMPTDTLFHGFLVFVGGLLLVTPGFVTDFLGLSFVMPGPRHLLLRYFKRVLDQKIRSGQIQVFTSGRGFSRGSDFRQGPSPFQQSYTQYEIHEEREVIDVTPESADSDDKGPK